MTPASTGLIGHLFYYAGVSWSGSKELRIYTGGDDGHGHSMKVLWRPRGKGSGKSLRIVGAQLDGSASFIERLPWASGPSFPSIVNVPAAGCWLLTFQTGTLIGTITVSAVEPR